MEDGAFAELSGRNSDDTIPVFSRVQSVVFHCSMFIHPCPLYLKAIIPANRPVSRPWICLEMCIVCLSHDIWSV